MERKEYVDRYRNVSRKVYITNDYSIFKRLPGNRGTQKSRVQKIESSIKKVGYISSPILVNEKFEIIDGQGRFEALKKLGKPIEFIEVENLGIDECISMNINMTNWSLDDYISSYAERGNENYRLLSAIKSEFPDISINVIATAAFDYLKMGGRDVKEGKIIFTELDYSSSKLKLDYVASIMGKMTNKYIKNNKEMFMQALIKCSSYEGVSPKVLADKVIKNMNKEYSWSKIDDCIRDMEDAYNYKSKTPHIYLLHMYEKSVNDKKQRFIHGIRGSKHE